MKKLWLSVLALGAFMAVSAQSLTVKSVSRVDVPETLIVSQAEISPDGNFVVVSDVASTALTRIDLSTGNTSRVTDNGSILDLKISADGNNVVYRQRTIDKNRLSHTGLKSTDLATGKTVEIVKPSRNFNGFRLSDAGTVNAFSSDNSKTRVASKSVNGGKTEKETVVGINRGHLVVSNGSTSTVLDPQGRGSYLWPSISPDGTKILYYLAQEGCFVCNIDGSEPVSLGYIHAPKWYNDNTVIGMQDIDDGTNITASTIVASDLKGNMERLTGEDVIAMYPSATNGRIVFSDNMGALYIMTVE